MDRSLPSPRVLLRTLCMVAPQLLVPKPVSEGFTSDHEPCPFLRSHTAQVDAAAPLKGLEL